MEAVDTKGTIVQRCTARCAVTSCKRVSFHTSSQGDQLDWLSEQSEDRDLNDREQAQMKELEFAKDNLTEKLGDYSYEEDRDDN